MKLTRRAIVQGTLAAAATALPLPGMSVRARPALKRIPSTQEALPAVGLGTWITFNVGEDELLRNECAGVMAAFFEAGGTVVDSSPMYGSAQSVIGYSLKKIGPRAKPFSADKVWTPWAAQGSTQIAHSRDLWGIPRFDLVQVHNLVAWEAHLETLFAMKAAGKLRYVGITTSEGRRHDLFEEIMRREPLDFIQVTYNIIDREAEDRILPLAAERGMAVIANRPFQQGALTRRLAREPLPGWAAAIGTASWAQFILKFIISHPAITVAIPATTRIDHVRENVAAADGVTPDESMRRRMAAYVRDL